MSSVPFEADQLKLRNKLLRAMSPGDFAFLVPYLSLHRADKGALLFRNGDQINTVWFPEHGVGSLMTISVEGRRSENGLFGYDGFAPVSFIFGSDQAPCDGQIQVAGEIVRISAEVLRTAVANSPSLSGLLLRYAHTLSIQIAYTALSNAACAIEVRLARWLLMYQDRVGEGQIALTHEFLSLMLTVHRPTITLALQNLVSRGLIRSERGRIIICNRSGLEELAGGVYGPPEREYDRLIKQV